MRKKIVLVVGARPNFIKAAPLMKELQNNSDKFETVMIHTGQHYDRQLSDLFFGELGMPKPDIFLGVGSGSHAVQTAGIMIALEKALQELQPDLVVVFGDINSTLAAAVVSAKLCIRLAHVEAGLRSFDRTMPEEINRMVTDRLSDFLFVSEKSGMVNLSGEGVPEEKIFFTGNIMIDSLVGNLKAARGSKIHERLELSPGNYIALTMHRPGNVDTVEKLVELMQCILSISEELPVVFPCHPRTAKRFEEFDIENVKNNSSLKIVEPLGYLDFLKLQSEAKLVVTDSGGIQEETTYLGVPCLTIRENTERPVTVEIGTNTICGTDPENIIENVRQILKSDQKQGSIPELWDGHTASRIVEILKEKLVLRETSIYSYK